VQVAAFQQQLAQADRGVVGVRQEVSALQNRQGAVVDEGLRNRVAAVTLVFAGDVDLLA
jgi:hypothetical protein